MQIVSLELVGFKSFGKKTIIKFDSAITSIVGPNGSGKSNVAEAVRFVLGEQSIKSMRGKLGTDLIFKGSNTLSPLARASVTAIFDNKNHNRNTSAVDGIFAFFQYDEVRITRQIYSDGANEYLINDTKVRLKDIQELLSTVSIGTTGHHIISQGEADRVLNASVRERKEMIEDALGLKLYQWRIKEAERKLEKSNIHLQNGELARKEIAPHLSFLKKQVERIENRKQQSEELSNLYNVYLEREEKEIESEKSALYLEGGSLLKIKEKQELQNSIKLLEEKVQSGLHLSETSDQIKNIEIQCRDLSSSRDEIYKRIVRLDAEESVLQKNIQKSQAYDEQEKNKQARVYIEKEKALYTRSELESSLEQISWRVLKQEFSQISNHLQLLKSNTKDFFDTLLQQDNKIESFIAFDTEELEKEIHTILSTRRELAILLEEKNINLRDKQRELESHNDTLNSKKDLFHNEEKSLYQMRSTVSEINRSIDNLESREKALEIKCQMMKNEIEEGASLIGKDIHDYLKKDKDIDTKEPDTRTQNELYRLIVRLKIKLEDSGVSNVSDILEEHRDATERDQFLIKEIEDLYKTKSDLTELIIDLKQKLDSEFSLGIEKINIEFNTFFTDMFGGGAAELSIVEKQKRNKKKQEGSDLDLMNIDDAESGDLETESGIDVSVALPQKKVRDLSMLSGGERALTSIALLFAISQVNPPPFMVLDETDAALDEANARRYGKSLRSLAKHSKLIVITHNRETMNQADSLYGVTVGKDGASKVLSVKFDEASEYAK